MLQRVSDFHRVLRLAGIGLWELDLETMDSLWTDETFRLFGMDASEAPIPFDALLERIHPDDRTRVTDVVRAAVHQKIDVEYRIVLAEGQIRFMRSQAIGDVDSGTGSVLGTIQDITIQKQTEEELRYGKQRYESLKLYNPNAICSLDREGRVIGANPVFQELSGYTLPELLHQPVIDWLFAPEDAERIHASRTSHMQDMELTLRRRDGHVMDVNLTSVPIVIDGGFIGIYAILTDITQQKRDRRELLEVQRLYKLISESSQDIIFTTDKDGICQYVSPSIHTLLGYDPEEVTGHRVQMLFHPADVDYVNSVGDKIARGIDVNRFTCRIRVKDGGYLWYETALKTLRDAAGEVLEIAGVGRDVSAHIVLQDSLEHAVRIAGLGHWDWDFKRQHIHCSNQMYSILGVTAPDEGDIVAGAFLHLVHPEDRPLLHQDVKRSIDLGRPFDRVFRVVREDESVRYLHAQGEVLFDGAGEAGRMFGTAQDITEQKLVEQQLKESEERYRRIVDNSLDAIGIHDGSVWQYMNDPGIQMFGGASERDVVGRPVDAFANQSDRKDVSEGPTLWLPRRTGAQSKTCTWTTLEGRPLYSETTTVPIEYRGKHCVQVIIRDISEQRQAEALLLRSEKLSAVGQLAAGVAHEIRNPLTALKGFTQMLHQGAKDQERRYFDIMLTELNRIEIILNEMLMLAKPQAVTFQPRDVGAIMREVVTLLGTQAIRNNIVIESDIASGLPPVHGDENQLKQVFINVLKNALEAMPSGGRLTVSVKRNPAESDESDSVCVECVDEGVGIPEHVLQNLGEPFFTTKPQGTGLGLMTSQRLVLAHNGQFEIASEIGRGTSVRIVLPGI